jgi:uncharacterized membrane protein YidH (DUF202 family)
VWWWIVGVLTVWTVVGLGFALVLGRGIRLADERSFGTGVDRLRVTPRDVAAVRRRSVPVPPVGVALAALAVILETIGYVTRVSGSRGSVATLLSMDAPLSLPRMFVTALFAAAGLAALVAAGRIPGRRTWWTTVGVVAAGIATVKGGGTFHARAIGALHQALGRTGALLVSVAVAAAVIGVLGFLSRAEQRDRRRILGILSLYAVASVGLSAVSAAASGPFWTAAATYVEESGEALTAVAFLVGVLVGVAPRLVLPADWALRREADAHTLEVAEVLPLRLAPGDPAGG